MTYFSVFNSLDWTTIFMKMTPSNKRFLRGWVHHCGRFLHHIGLAGLSALIALSLPWMLNFIAREVLVYWSLIGDEKVLVVSIEMGFAVLFAFLFYAVGRSWKDRRLSNMAREAGLVLVKPARGFFTRKKTKNLKEEQGFAKDVMIIGSTGFRTFADPKGDLHQVVRNCRMAKIMLLNPFSDGARARCKSILDPQVTPETFLEQIKKSIAFLKGLRRVNKEVKLKLYSDAPLLKLVVLDDHIWIQHYHAGLTIDRMPEFVFKHDQNLGSLYVPLYQFFMTKWNDFRVPEYDLETDQLIYRDAAGNEQSRRRLNAWEEEAALRVIPRGPRGPSNSPSLGRVICPSRETRRSLGCIDEALRNIW